MPKITPCLWFDGQAEEAASFYAAIFKNSRITQVARPGGTGRALVVAFELEGQAFTALNGGPMFKFNEAVSFQVDCRTQEEVDYYWEKLSEGGDENAQRCGWLKDKFGVSWQVVPTVLPSLIGGPDPVKSQRAMAAMFQMKKLIIDELERAYAG